MEVVKIRLQAQQHSLADPLEIPRYRNAAHAVYTIVREEGFSALYRGVSLTAFRQATNQGTKASFCISWGLVLINDLYRRTQERTSLYTKNSRKSSRKRNLTLLSSLHGRT